ncbi:Permease, partial [Giardia duodenalis]
VGAGPQEAARSSPRQVNLFQATSNPNLKSVVQYLPRTSTGVGNHSAAEQRMRRTAGGAAGQSPTGPRDAPNPPAGRQTSARVAWAPGRTAARPPGTYPVYMTIGANKN